MRGRIMWTWKREIDPLEIKNIVIKVTNLINWLSNRLDVAKGKNQHIGR